jgi:hypothetical protein
MRLAYSDKLKDPRWQRKRLEIMGRDNFTCVACANTDRTLTVHHLWYTGEPWEAPDSDLQTLCEPCHDELGTHRCGGIGYCKDDCVAMDGRAVPCLIGERCPNCRGPLKDKGSYMRCTDGDCPGFSTADLTFAHGAFIILPDRK